MFLARLWQSMPSAVSLGFLWGVMTLGVYLTYRILDFADLTVDGSFALGGAVLARLATIGIDPFLATLLSFCAGMLAGACTGLMHTKLKIPGLLASILTQIGLYSINLHIMGKANISLNTFVAGKRTTLTMFSQFPSFGMSDKTVILVYGGIIVAIVIALLWWFLNTEIGIAVRSTGDNERMSRALGINTNAMKLLCLMLSNGLVGLSGALIAQNNAVATLDMGTGGIGSLLGRRHHRRGDLPAQVAPGQADRRDPRLHRIPHHSVRRADPQLAAGGLQAALGRHHRHRAGAAHAVRKAGADAWQARR